MRPAHSLTTVNITFQAGSFADVSGNANVEPASVAFSYGERRLLLFRWWYRRIVRATFCVTDGWLAGDSRTTIGTRYYVYLKSLRKARAFETLLRHGWAAIGSMLFFGSKIMVSHN